MILKLRAPQSSVFEGGWTSLCRVAHPLIFKGALSRHTQFSGIRRKMGGFKGSEYGGYSVKTIPTAVRSFSASASIRTT